MLYKFRAYQNEPQPIADMNDFRVHCSVPGYICTKRFDFTNAELAARNRKNFTDEKAYPDEKSLVAAMLNDDVAALARDENFMKKWREREYFRDGGRVAKWENAEK